MERMRLPISQVSEFQLINGRRHILTQRRWISWFLVILPFLTFPLSYGMLLFDKRIGSVDNCSDQIGLHRISNPHSNDVAVSLHCRSPRVKFVTQVPPADSHSIHSTIRILSHL